MDDETASTTVVGRTYVKHRFVCTDSIASGRSYEVADFKLLREHEHRQVPQLSDDNRRDDFSFWIFMLLDSIDVFRALFYQDDAALYKYSPTWCDRR